MAADFVVERFLNSPVTSNCYVISKPGCSGCLIVDPSFEHNELIENYLRAYYLVPEFIVITHEHFDHIGSVEYFRNKYKSKLISTSSTSHNIGLPKKNLSIFFDNKGFACSPADFIVDEESLEFWWDDVQLNFVLTPGHTEGGLCFFINNKLFSGDTLMNELNTVVKLPGGSKEKLSQSLTALSKRCDFKTIVYPGHGTPFIVSEGTFKNDNL